MLLQCVLPNTVWLRRWVVGLAHLCSLFRFGLLAMSWAHSPQKKYLVQPHRFVCFLSVDVVCRRWTIAGTWRCSSRRSLLPSFFYIQRWVRSTRYLAASLTSLENYMEVQRDKKITKRPSQKAKRTLELNACSRLLCEFLLLLLLSHPSSNALVWDPLSWFRWIYSVCKDRETCSCPMFRLKSRGNICSFQT
jgi:hypothetical protein